MAEVVYGYVARVFLVGRKIALTPIKRFNFRNVVLLRAVSPRITLLFSMVSWGDHTMGNDQRNQCVPTVSNASKS